MGREHSLEAQAQMCITATHAGYQDGKSIPQFLGYGVRFLKLKDKLTPKQLQGVYKRTNKTLVEYGYEPVDFNAP